MLFTLLTGEIEVQKVAEILELGRVLETLIFLVRTEAQSDAG